MTDDTDAVELTDGTETRTDVQAHEGVSITGKVTRGSEPRDKDVLKIKGKGTDAAAAVADFEDALTAAEERGWADRLRAMQPGEEDDA